MPSTPQYEAGMRMDPPVSVASPKSTTPAATATCGTPPARQQAAVAAHMGARGIRPTWHDAPYGWVGY
jgi:hypothetical protein